jgi:hypothetical protein
VNLFLLFAAVDVLLLVLNIAMIRKNERILQEIRRSARRALKSVCKHVGVDEFTTTANEDAHATSFATIKAPGRTKRRAASRR